MFHPTIHAIAHVRLSDAAFADESIAMDVDLSGALDLSALAADTAEFAKAQGYQNPQVVSSWKELSIQWLSE